MSDCLFCKIAAGEIPSDKVRESGELFAFRDIAPAGTNTHSCRSKTTYRLPGGSERSGAARFDAVCDP